MDPRRFDILTQSLATARTRRGVLAGLGALLLGGRAAAQVDCPLAGQTRNARGQCTCPAGTDPCPETNVCADRKRDLANCGRCGNACGLGAACVKGECRCPRGEIRCDDGSCASPTDAANCGCTRERCPVGETCAAGTCICGSFERTAAPCTCCPGGGSAICSGLCSSCGLVVADTCEGADGTVQQCPPGYAECRGTETRACCPPGTICDPQGFCRQ